jgi:hypothetical protein
MSERSRNSQGTRRAKTGETLTGLTLVYIVGRSRKSKKDRQQVANRKDKQRSTKRDIEN